MKKNYNFILVNILQIFCLSAFAQPTNDNCSGAIPIPINNACLNGPFDNTGSTQSYPNCTGTATVYDVWFSFVTYTNAQKIHITGLNNFQVDAQVYSSCTGTAITSCINYSTLSSTGYSLVGLNSGQIYYIRVFNDYSGNYYGMFDICLPYTPSGIEDNELLENITLYPNPSTETIKILTPDESKINSIVLYNSIGQQMEVIENSKCEVNLQKYTPGIYSILLNTDKGFLSKKIVKE
ncbi:MAG: T9SS type A sorting domain-containing protein [Bacteroidetes bacterium]|nr:T9SS type A sorting domain-containing protein [Bacteroidota bacterium]